MHCNNNVANPLQSTAPKYPVPELPVPSGRCLGAETTATFEWVEVDEFSIDAVTVLTKRGAVAMTAEVGVGNGGPAQHRSRGRRFVAGGRAEVGVCGRVVWGP